MFVGRSSVKTSAKWPRVALFVIVLAFRDVSCMRRVTIDVTRAPYQNTADKFTIFDTTVQCDDDFKKQHWCNIRNADYDRTHESCKCVCRRNFLTFLPELRTCVDNRDVYSFLGGCTKRIQDQTGFPPLPVVSGRRDVTRFQLAVVPWPSRYVLYSSTEICTVSHENSFYRFQRQWVPIQKDVFSLQRNNQLLSTKAVLQWSNNVPNLYSGRILRLDLVNCSDLWRGDVRHPGGGCMLLKVAGNISDTISPARTDTTSELPTTPTSSATGKAISLASFAVESNVSSTNSTASPTKTQIAPEPSMSPAPLSTSSPPLDGRREKGTRALFNPSPIIMIGGAVGGFLVLLVVVVVLVKLCRGKRRSDDYPVKKRAKTEKRNNFKNKDIRHCVDQAFTEASRRTSSVTSENPSRANGEMEIRADPSSKFAQTNLAYQTTDIVNGLRNLRPTAKDVNSDRKDESPYLGPSYEVIKHNTIEEPAHVDPLHEDPEYHVLEEGPSNNDETPNGVSDDGHALGSPECEESTAEQPDYAVLEGPDSGSQEYGFLVGKTPDTYAALRGQRQAITSPSSQGEQVYAPLKRAREERDYQTIRSICALK